MTALQVPRRWTGGSLFAPYRGRFGVSRCRDCDLILANPRPSAELLDRFYQDAHQHRGGESAATTSARLDRMETAIGKRGSLLDVGCGRGELVRAAVDRGWRATGYDIAAPSITASHANGVTVTNDLRRLETASFTAIHLAHVFEHVAEPGAMLEQLGRLLARDGHLLIEVPNVQSLRARLSLPVLSRWSSVDERYRAFPIHLFYYSAASLGRMLARHGLRVTACSTSGVGIDTLLDRGDDEPRRDAIYESRGAHASRSKQLVKRMLLDLGLGENLFVTASYMPPH